jgi:predicted transcriptional regulator
MENSAEFIDCYNKIDIFLKNSEQYSSTDTFSQKVKNSKNAVVKSNKDELISLGELRNAIVHNPRIGGRAIAEPHESTVIRIKELYEQITNPKKVMPLFDFKVLGARKKDYINDILDEMKQKSFSQFPVYDEDGRVIELINTNTIARWLSAKLYDNGAVLIDEVKVEDLISEIEFKKNYKFISRNISVYDAYELFIDQIIKKGRNLDVLFITHSGKESEKLLGLITIEDIAHVVKR